MDSVTRATIVALMRDNWQDPVGFHEDLARLLDIGADEIAPAEEAER